jgi:hypothetical protein
MAAALNVDSHHQYHCDYRLHGGPCLEEAEAALHAFGLCQRISSKRFPDERLDMFVSPIVAMFPGVGYLSIYDFFGERYGFKVSARRIQRSVLRLRAEAVASRRTTLRRILRRGPYESQGPMAVW